MKKLLMMVAVLCFAVTAFASPGVKPGKDTKPKTEVSKNAAEATQCAAKTKKGDQCSRKAVKGGKYCAQHAKMMKGK